MLYLNWRVQTSRSSGLIKSTMKTPCQRLLEGDGCDHDYSIAIPSVPPTMLSSNSVVHDTCGKINKQILGPLFTLEHYNLYTLTLML